LEACNNFHAYCADRLPPIPELRSASSELFGEVSNQRVEPRMVAELLQ
jgi:hypothetical protein